MKKKLNQKWQLKLHKRNLKYGRLNQSGETRWVKKDWEIRDYSLLPMGIFYTVTSFVMRCVKEVPDKSFPALKQAIVKGLCEAAIACDCSWKVDSARGDVLWLLNGHRFYAFQVENFHKHRDAKLPDLRALLRERRSRFGKMERKSRAMLRGSWVVLKGTFVKFIPGKTRND